MVYTISLTRHYGTNDAATKYRHQFADRILRMVAASEHVQSVTLAENDTWICTDQVKDVPLNKDRTVFFTCQDLVVDSGTVRSIAFVLWSSTLNPSQIVDTINSLSSESAVQSHAPGAAAIKATQLYYDQYTPVHKVSRAPYDDPYMNRLFELQNMPKQLTYTCRKFVSNKSFDNLFGEDIDLVRKRVERFTCNKAWYTSKGVPYQLGILMSGSPGTGKTSCIRAIANYTGRHIVNVNFSQIQTVTQLKNLFFSETLDSIRGSDHDIVPIIVPVEKRLYVIEEIDALGDIVYARKNTEPVKVLPEELTLGEILQVLDGNMETPGRILAQLYENLMDAQIPADVLAQIPDKSLSPSQVTEICLRHMDNPRSAQQKLIATAGSPVPPSPKTGFEYNPLTRTLDNIPLTRIPRGTVHDIFEAGDPRME
ncbi:hypothetical protein GGF32_003807 [Allomyces javanicus]|nr:hypothetical protein GGF32_003807 [Allomyces javanicus]